MAELRQDLVSKDWIIIAPERGKRPYAFINRRGQRNFTPKSTCPFEDLQETGNWPPILSYPNTRHWRAVILPNKYPAVMHHEDCTTIEKKGLYQFANGIGHHDLLVTRDHGKTVADIPLAEATEIFGLLQERYRDMVKDKCLSYVSAFCNWGENAGASISHPHYQILTLPIIPPNINDSLSGSEHYYKKYRACPHCAIVKHERKERVRMVHENRHAVALAPFASREPFEVRVYPKQHNPYFERTSRATLSGVVDILRFTLRALRVRVSDPDLNFFIHSAPVKNQQRYRHYHWHIEVVPKMTTGAGFEISTGLEINTVAPEAAARILNPRNA